MIPTNDLVDLYLRENREYRQRDQGHTRTGWRASSLGNCLRKQTYARLGVPSLREFDAQTLRTFSYGDTIHDWLKRFYRNSGVMLAEEGKLTALDLDLAGHYDVLLTSAVQDITDAQRERWSPWWRAFVERLREAAKASIPDNGEIVIGEIKSISPYAFKYVKSDGAKPEHQLQIGAYMLMAERDPSQLPAMPTTGRVIYVSKDSKEPILEFEYRPEWADAALDVVNALNIYWSNDQLPPCTCEGWMVSYCDYLTPLGQIKKKSAKAGIDCCNPDLYAPALIKHKTAELEAEKEDG